MAKHGQRKVCFDDIMCCALVHGFIRHPRLLARWTETEGRLKLLANILPKTLVLGFEADDQVALIYRVFAQAELHRLSEAHRSHNLRCRHSVDRHKKALQKIIELLPKSTSH